MLEQNPYLSLMGMLDFTAADLAYNRRGQLSHRQKRNLRRQRVQRIRQHLLLTLPLALVSLAAGVRLTITLVGIGLMVGLTLVTWLRASLDLKSWVEQISGRPNVARGLLTRWQHHVWVNGQRFAVGQRTRYAFIDGRCYRLYYAPASRTILSAEPLR